MGSLTQTIQPRFVQITPVTHTVAAGGAGWIDTDISGDVPVTATAVHIRSSQAGAGNSGVREDGSSVSTDGAWGNGIRVDWTVNLRGRNRIVELYRNAVSDNGYYVMGYWIDYG